MFGGEPYYEIEGSAYALWWLAMPGFWALSTAPGITEPGFWSGGIPIEDPYIPQGTYTGNPVVSAVEG